MRSIMHQTFLKDCDCSTSGIIVNEGIAYCRWCCKPYGMGGSILYPEGRFKQSIMSTDNFVWTDELVKEFVGSYVYLDADRFKQSKHLQFLADQAQELKLGYELSDIEKINKRLDDIEKKLQFKK